MKKIYQIPALHTVSVSTATLVATSLGKDSSTENQITSSEDILVKGQSASYNVWEDDWSK